MVLHSSSINVTTRNELEALVIYYDSRKPGRAILRRAMKVNLENWGAPVRTRSFRTLQGTGTTLVIILEEWVAQVGY